MSNLPIYLQVSIARRRFVVLRLEEGKNRRATRWLVSIARRRFVVLRPGAPPCQMTSPTSVSIARRRFVVLQHRSASPGAEIELRFNRPQAIRCLATVGMLRRWWFKLCVSIARRRFVVLRLPAAAGWPPARPGFQSPAGDSLSCDTGAIHNCCDENSKFQSPAGDSLSCDDSAICWMVERVDQSFNRPQAIRCLATSDRISGRAGPYCCFNRPQAIRCLATRRQDNRCARSQ